MAIFELLDYIVNEVSGRPWLFHIAVGNRILPMHYLVHC